MINLSIIEELRTEGRLVGLRRGRFDDRTTGFIVRNSPDFLVMSVVESNCSFDGTAIVRVPDVSYVEWDTIRLRGRSRVLAESPSSPDVVDYLDLSSWESIVRSAAAQVPVLVFRCEDLDSSRFDVGTRVRVDGECVRADNLTVDGVLEGEFAIDMDDLTRIEFGGGYELALWRMLRTARREA